MSVCVCVWEKRDNLSVCASFHVSVLCACWRLCVCVFCVYSYACVRAGICACVCVYGVSDNLSVYDYIFIFMSVHLRKLSRMSGGEIYRETSKIPDNNITLNPWTTFLEYAQLKYTMKYSCEDNVIFLFNGWEICEIPSLLVDDKSALK